MKHTTQRTVRSMTRCGLAALLAASPLVGANLGCGENDNSQAVKKVRESRSLYLEAQSEAELGQAVTIKLTNKYPASRDARLNQYVNLVGATVASAGQHPDSTYYFGVLDTDEVGSFSAPGGFVLVTRGAISRMQDEAELAGVLAQEIARIERRQAMEEVGKTGLLAHLDQLAKQNDRSAAFGQIVDALYDVIAVKGYGSNRDETAAAEAVSILDNANYSAQSYVSYLQRQQQWQSGNKAKVLGAPADISARLKRAQSDVSAAKPGQKLAERFAQYVSRSPTS